jgi:phenylalanyl-tRNA synthetase beta chain
MRVPISWLKSYVDINLPVEELAERLTMAGLEVGGIDLVGDWWDPETIVVGQVAAVLPHPDADRLVLVDVDYGGDAPERVVTGAPNLFQYRGQDTLPTLKVAFAMSGAVLVDAYSDQTPRPMKKLKPSKIRGVKSSGMVCSERELGLSEEHEGIIVLTEDAPVGTPLRDYLGEAVLDIELTPDMARALSVIGVAREVAALTGAALHLPADEWQPSGDDDAADYVAVKIDDPDLCNRYTGVMVLDAKIGPSPKWMQDRLQRAGMRPISNVVDITNYVMLETGQPLHAFDYDILKRRAAGVGDAKPTIIVRRAQAGEKFMTLDDVTRTLDDSMLMICDTAGSIAIAGVMGGQESEVSDATVNILLESATFEGINNRRTSTALRLPSEASYRFARGVPATLNPIAARRAAELMRLYAGARIVPGMVDTYPVPQPERTVYTTISDMRRILGIPVTKDDVVDSLQRLDFVVTEVSEPNPAAGEAATFALHRKAGEPLFECVAPWHRLDINIPADLTEEVARMIGYEQVGLSLLDTELPTQRRNELLETEARIRDILTAAGMQETINHPLTSPENHDKLHPGKPASREDAYIVITNPIAPERRAMRRTMLVSALENLVRNLRYSDRLTTFELGRVYLPERGDAELPLEERRMSLLVCGPRQTPSLYNQSDADEMDFFDLKGIVETLLARLDFGPGDIRFEAAPDTDPFGPRCAQVFLDGTAVGTIGEIHPAVRNAFGLPKVRVVAADLAIAPLVRPHWRLEPMQPISSYPPVVEDLAFEVAEEVTTRRIQDLINDAGGALLVNVELFDVYRGEPLAAGSKSLAYALTYQSTERSLSDKDVARVREKIIRVVEQETGGTLRR